MCYTMLYALRVDDMHPCYVRCIVTAFSLVVLCDMPMTKFYGYVPMVLQNLFDSRNISMCIFVNLSISVKKSLYTCATYNSRGTMT